MARLLRLAKHHGVQPDHIDFSIQIHSLDVSGPIDEKIQIVVSRGSRSWPGTATSVTNVDGHWRAQWMSPIQIASNLFPSKKGPKKYDTKSAKIEFKRVVKANTTKTFGIVEIDLAEFCDGTNSGPQTRPLQKCADKNAKADFSIGSLMSQKDVSPSMM